MRVFEISRMTNKNGPGIRTLVHFKGCPLRCVWCSTPESQRSFPELKHTPERCIGCSSCAGVCPSGAVRIHNGISEIDRDRCIRCFSCVRECPSRALVETGYVISPDRLATEILKDKVFFEHSGGGVTFSGGEPLLHADEDMEDLYRILKDAGVSIGVDTTGYVPWASIERLLPYIDFFLWDLKYMDSVKHKELTGVGNDLILDNLLKVDERYSEYKIDVYIRCIQVPGMTDDDANLAKTCDFIKNLSCVRELDLINFHNLGASRYRSIGRAIPLSGLLPLEDAVLFRKQSFVNQLGVPCRIV